MDWIKQNKFLAGWLGVTLLGVIALGYLLFSAKGAYSTAQEDFTSKVAELQTLQNQTPFPDEENLKKMQELQKAHQAAITQLHQDLAKTEIPVVPLSAVRFQDELRESVRRVTTEAASKPTPVKLPDKFYMAFERYQAEPPKDEAAAPLGRMLKAMEAVMKQLIAAGVTELTEIKRENLPEEGGEKSPAAPPAPGAKPAKESGPELVKRMPFDITFVAAEPDFKTFLNAIVSFKEQFLIPKFVVVENEKLTGPPKVGATPPGVPTPQDASGAETSAIRFVFGEEKLKVAMRIEVVDFADPPGAATAAK